MPERARSKDGPHRSFLIHREETRRILEGEDSRNDIGAVRQLVNDFLLPNYAWLQ